MGGANRDGWSPLSPARSTWNKYGPPYESQLTKFTGGKAKPLKAPKKQNKEMDEEDIAFAEKKKAGTLTSFKFPSIFVLMILRHNRGEGPQGDGSQGPGQGPSGERRHQEEWQEIDVPNRPSTTGLKGTICPGVTWTSRREVCSARGNGVIWLRQHLIPE